MRVAHDGRLPPLESFTLVATVWPTTPGKGLQGVVSCSDQTGQPGAALSIGEDGSACARLGSGDTGAIEARVGVGLKARCWYRIWASYDARSGKLTAGQFHDQLAATATGPIDALGINAALEAV